MGAKSVGEPLGHGGWECLLLVLSQGNFQVWRARQNPVVVVVAIM